MNLKMLYDRVLLKPIFKEDMSDSIIMPDMVQKKPIKFQVIDIGDYVEQVKIGQYVLIGEYTGIQVSKDKQVYRIVDQEQILAIVD